MLPVSLEEATIERLKTVFKDLEIGQRFIDANNPDDVIFEKINPDEAWVVTGEAAGEIVFPNHFWSVRKITMKA